MFIGKVTGGENKDDFPNIPESPMNNFEFLFILAAVVQKAHGNRTLDEQSMLVASIMKEVRNGDVFKYTHKDGSLLTVFWVDDDEVQAPPEDETLH